ncbi:CgeB family protein [Paenibacillus contaminans]|uniref:Spore maturation protein cgeB n=1 Tax=Paenibacillus contaminans TaxID=450362 RepID=A0A329MQ77_9BACL|nr:glycosyltransferase [Paenibacillus contaminans]RAV22079.1 spore maturation protein cgeB [Paenibacillus contaminans]
MNSKPATKIRRGSAPLVKRRATKRTAGPRRKAAGGSWSRGRADGYREGINDGNYFGECNAVIAKIPKDHSPRIDLKVLYVTSGKGFPYSPLDEGVIQALSEVVTARHVVSPNANAVAAARQIRPDLVLVLEGMEFSPEHIRAIRAEGIPTAIWFTDDPYYSDLTPRLAAHYDYVFTQDVGCVDFYRKLGHSSVHHMPLAAHPVVYRPLPIAPNYRKDVSFIGSAFWNRVHFMDQVSGALARKRVLISGWWWQRLKSYRKLASQINTKAWMGPLETARHYFGSKIVINIHRSATDDSWNSNRRRIPAQSVNPRTFEIAACGAFQLTDIRSDLSTMYRPGEEIVTYDSPHDFVEKMNHYLTHERERKNISLRGLRRTLLEHTYPKRLRAIFKIIFPHKFVPLAEPEYVDLEQMMPKHVELEKEVQIPEGEPDGTEVPAGKEEGGYA